ncbi:protein mono-ADP-ribosyltransferase PARP12-like isoform X1 [Myxocyprinus asiaticus]|uniref:protein mono-ADP-ribosyltransferase PARP12-like isoform X1 n=1 Tax=Myxocyprinus asiaticus TaxID=70543 RepID=UPI0022226C7B|nr:protein mono-ADP-ribosyltransferase PARP12-like isoform X1 [Myxocyprinus asiaticus]
MAEETVLQILCGSNGAMDYERLLDISYGLTEIFRDNSLDKIIENSELFTVIQHNDRKEVFAQTRVKMCKISGCNEVCNDIHLCKYQLMIGDCNRRGCSFGHQLMSQHNIGVLRANHMIRLSREELCVILLQCDNSLLPPVCASYNKGRGPYGNCPDKETCTRLHMCMSHIRGHCDDTDCSRSHDFHEPHPIGVLRRRGVSSHLMSLIPFIYRNILNLKSHSNPKNTQPDLNNREKTRCESPQTHAEENKICLSFVRGYCKSADECRRIHCKMPYKWQVKVCGAWTDLPNNEHIEREYCDPSNIHSSGNEPICFEEMILGLDKVRRLSTEPSVLWPSFIHTTSWAWYWKDEYNHWILYASIKEMHRLSSVSSHDLEKEYQEYLLKNDSSNQDAVVKFRAGSCFYELSFKDMKQRNEVSGTERPVRRRPVFVSSVNIEIARKRSTSTALIIEFIFMLFCGILSDSFFSDCSEKHANARLHFSKGVPRFWDQKVIRDSGFERVRLSPSHRDYRRVQDLFNETLSSFTIRQIERVQNRELWEDFMMKKEEMRKANNEKFGERLLFHGTKSSLVDAVCHRNVDFDVSNAAVYGHGIYFSKDAQYSHEITDGCGVRMMFVCRVLLGFYTRGKASFRCPPTKDAKGNLYDSCVNDPRHPSIFVVFDRSQVYPEFLVTYEEKNVFDAVRDVQSSPDARVVSVTTSLAQVSVKETSQENSVTAGSEHTASSSSSEETKSLSLLS